MYCSAIEDATAVGMNEGLKLSWPQQSLDLSFGM